MNEVTITTYQDEYHVIKIHWSDVQDFYDEQDNNNGYIYGMEWEDEVEVDCQWFKSKKERDTEYNEMIASGHYKENA